MRELYVSDIDLNSLMNINPEIHSESDIYLCGDKIYKIFLKKTSISVLKRKEKKIDILSNMPSLPNVVLPQEKIISFVHGKRKFIGYTMDYIKGSTLYEKEFVLIPSLYLKLLRDISLSLEDIHNYNKRTKIVLCDFSSTNIMIDDNLNHYFTDFDSVAINKIPCDRFSALVDDYFRYRHTYFNINRNFDRLSSLLCLFDYLFNYNLPDLSIYDFDRASEELTFLKEIRELFIELKKTDRILPYIPYLYEFMGESEIKDINSLSYYRKRA